MSTTPDSHKLMLFFEKHNCLPHIKQTQTTNILFKKLYREIDTAVKYINQLKDEMGDQFYKLKIDKIQFVKQIPKPSTFPVDSFPRIVRKHIDENSLASLTYSFQLFGRPITIIFLIEDDKPEIYIDKYNTYVDRILIWLHIVNKYASKSCAEDLTIFIYHTTLTKELPKSSIEILNECNVNTAFTASCPKKSEIVVFRKEEWFKVFIHETFHNFGLDFSDMNVTDVHSNILSIFPVNSDINLFEAYTEFWARIMNVLFCSYFNSKPVKGNKNIETFIESTEYLMNFEIMYAFFQMVKVLHFMNLEYKQLYETDTETDNIRKTLYKENTSVLSYYVITLILMYNYQSFLLWCSTNNDTLLQFKKTSTNQYSFFRFIEKKYKTNMFIKNIDCSVNLFKKVKDAQKKSDPKKHKNLKYLMNNLRMSICELG
jgi:hypothetical protein